jgi:NosR/NirI family transcriptional regulator, nitrous oxide reductase regulator
MTGKVRLLLLTFTVIAMTCMLPAVSSAQQTANLDNFLATVEPAQVFPEADRFGPLQGSPPVVPAYRGDRLLGYAFLNSDFVNAVGYSGKPIHIVVGLDLDGTIAGARLVEHKEPIVLIGIPERRITAFIDGFIGRNALRPSSATDTGTSVDIVSGATVTVLVMGDSIMRSAGRVAQLRGLGGAQPEVTAAIPPPARTLDLTTEEIRDWESLVGEGSLRRLHLTVGDINEAFVRSGNEAAVARPEPGEPDSTFIDLYTALVSAPTIGRSLLGETAYDRLRKRLKPGQQAILVAGNGTYSFKGSGYVRGGIFDRIEVIQDQETIRFRDRNHERINQIAADEAPRFQEISIFAVPEGTELNPVEPWRLQLLVQRSVGARDKAFLTFDVTYQVPERYVRTEQRAVVADTPDIPAEDATNQAAPPQGIPSPAQITGAPDQPLWQRIWRSSTVDIAILGTSLGVLTGIFFFQHQLVKRPRLYDRVRLAFLTFTLFWLGWWVTAQLSVVNVLTFTNALITGFSWDYFLLSPLVFLLWSAVAVSMLFWARGAFCGWLCPFGALQELTNRIGRTFFKVPQIRVPWGLHERLWPIKYIIFLGLFGLSLYSLTLAEKVSEVEPFKTAIVLRFVREWPFVTFAVGLLVANLFIERFFCRYLCPLGAALAIPARLRMFDWLRRYRECGNPCQRCANECPVQSIHPEGHINVNECISCMHCQMLYHHDHKCPVVIQKRLKREKRQAMSSPTAQPGGRKAEISGLPDGRLQAVPARGDDLLQSTKE